MLLRILQVVIVAWAVSEIVLGRVKRASRSGAEVRDRASLRVLWITIGVCVPAGLVFGIARVAPIGVSGQALLVIALVLLLAGLAIRWHAILKLGKFFTGDVAIHQEHRLVRTGLYRWVRHPSYVGLLLAFTGLGLSYVSWLSLVVVLVPVTLAVLYRIRVEEQALEEAFGEEYAEYRGTTKRLIPWVY